MSWKAVRAVDRLQFGVSPRASGPPNRSGLMEVWLANFESPQRHHIWPKWLLGNEDQVCMTLPRCVHNMSRVGLDDGGFHQVLNRLFEQSGEFNGLKAEDKRGFDRLYGNAKPAEQATLRAEVRRLLVKAYDSLALAPSTQGKVRARVDAELTRPQEKS